MEHSLPKLIIRNGGEGGDTFGPIVAGANPYNRPSFKVDGEFKFKRVYKASEGNLTLVSTVGLGGDAVISHYAIDHELPGHFAGYVNDFIDRLITTLKVQNYRDKENLWLVEVHWRDLAGEHGHRQVTLEPWERMLHDMLSMDVFNFQSYLTIAEAQAIDHPPGQE